MSSSNKKYKVLVTLPELFRKYCDEMLEQLTSNNCEITDYWWIAGGMDRKELLEKLKDMDACIIGPELIDREALDHGPNLLIACKFGVGVDNFDIPTATEKKVIICNAPGANSDAVAEFTMGLMLAVTKEIVISHQIYHNNDFRLVIGPELSGKTLGIIGMGNIGKRVARMAKYGFNMNVIGFDIMPDPNFAAQNSIVYKTLPSLLKESDIISVHVPLTKNTRNLISKKELLLMKDNAYLINAARGGVVNEEDLYEVMKSGKIAGAAMDVWAEEPPVKKVKLLDLPNVVSTTHSAGNSYEGVRGEAAICADNIIRVFNGRKPQFMLNPDVVPKINLVD